MIHPMVVLIGEALYHFSVLHVLVETLDEQVVVACPLSYIRAYANMTYYMIVSIDIFLTH